MGAKYTESLLFTISSLVGIKWCPECAKRNKMVQRNSLRQKDPWVMIDGGEKVYESGRITSSHPPTCQGVTNFKVGAWYWQAECLGSKELLGLLRDALYWLGDNDWESTRHSVCTTLLQRLSRQWSHTSDQSQRELSLRETQALPCA